MQTAEQDSRESAAATESTPAGSDLPPEPVGSEPAGRLRVRIESAYRDMAGRSPQMAAFAWFGLTMLIAGVPSALMPTPGFDPSWQAGIGFAVSADLRFGTDIVFNYGPWGFLDWPQHVSRPQAVLGFLFSTTAVLALYWVIYLCVRLRWTAGIAGLIAFAVTVASGPAGPGGRLVYAGLLFALLTLHDRAGRATSGWRDTMSTVLLTAVGALLLQVKFSEGVVLLVLAGLVAVSVGSVRDLVRGVGACLATFVVTFLALWLAAGQRITDISPWVRGSQEISSGYQEALAIEQGEYVVGYLAAGVLAIVVGVLALRRALRHRAVATAGVVVVSGVMLGFGFKHGFTRHDPAHEISFFLAAGFLLIGFATWVRRPAVVVAAATAAFLMAPSSLANYDPFLARNQWRTGTELLVNNEYRLTSVEASRARARDTYRLPENVLSELTGRPVHVDPTELTLPWAYALDWHPVPVFQSFSAYTPYLDEINAEALVAAPGDQVVLQEATVGIDRRNIRWDTPRYLLALACNYRAGARADRWSVLHHGQNRCSPPQTTLTQPVTAGTPVAVPQVGPGEILVARYRPQPSSMLASLVHLGLKDWSPIEVGTDDGTFRLPEALTDGPLLVSLPAEVAWQAPFDAFHYRQLTFNRGGTIEFQVIRVQ
ncbi:hypothetical protein [Micromonospora sp. WMMD710]|uniref:hypothetical protein n=1 Tax=Micromonospora sp. WMMD710 TaxID=3016085 RepID=UPI0024169367|nr:hypothetical protein [Micromonospora sp. WMMD710]MDG4759777.1 hypothetical protein [Micromonospora sp. WMMD710]